MQTKVLASVFVILLGVSRIATGTPITWQTTGTVGVIFPGFCIGACLTFDRPDTSAFTATFTFDPDEIPRRLGGGDIYSYHLQGASFQWGSTLSIWSCCIGFIDTNIGNPDFGSDPHSGTFLVGIASVEAAGHGAILSLLFNDPRAVDGFLPSDPTQTTAFYGRLDWGGVGPNNQGQALLSLSNPVPVPEPSTLMLLAAGAAIARTFRRRAIGRESKSGAIVEVPTPSA